MVGESWDVFTKPVLVEKLSGIILYENHGEARLPAPFAELTKVTVFSRKSNV